jgi:hypothetical protein
MSDLTFYDAAVPPAGPPAADGVCLYIGGDCVHIWTDAEIAAQKARYRLPIFVRSNPPGPGAAADVVTAIARLKAIGAPRGTLVALDMETAADPAYVKTFAAGLESGGYKLIVYGSESTERGNQAPGGWYFGADWTGTAHIHPGDEMTQWRSLAAYDEDLAEATLPFWDTHPKVAAPAAKPATVASPRQWITAGQSTLHDLAAGHGTQASTILRLTCEHSPGQVYPANIAAWLDQVFAGTASVTKPMPAGLHLWLP